MAEIYQDQPKKDTTLRLKLEQEDGVVTLTSVDVDGNWLKSLLTIDEEGIVVLRSADNANIAVGLGGKVIIRN